MDSLIRLKSSASGGVPSSSAEDVLSLQETKIRAHAKRRIAVLNVAKCVIVMSDLCLNTQSPQSSLSHPTSRQIQLKIIIPEGNMFKQRKVSAGRGGSHRQDVGGGVLYCGRYPNECPCTSDTRGYDLVVSFTSKRAPSGNPFCFICQKPDVMNDCGSMKYCESVLRLNTHLKRVQY